MALLPESEAAFAIPAMEGDFECADVCDGALDFPDALGCNAGWALELLPTEPASDAPSSSALPWLRRNNDRVDFVRL